MNVTISPNMTFSRETCIKYQADTVALPTSERLPTILMIMKPTCINYLKK